MMKHDFTGIKVDTFENNIYDYTKENNLIITQKFYQNSKNCKILEFTFSMEIPMRFNINVLIPEDVFNSCVTINNQNLIGPFKSELPEGESLPCEFGCKSSDENHHVISTLKPGNYQNVNFKWFPKDVLKFYFYYN